MRLLTLLALLLAAPAALAQQVVYESAPLEPAAPAERLGGTVHYQHDDGTGNVNIGPPSSFDPDMLWGNYFLTQEGGEVITQIQVAFGPTFPSLANGPVTFWLLDDPDMDLDPRNATALTSVQGTPDVFGNTFFVVDIPPTAVSGAFFVGASAQLQGGQDAPGRVDTSSPADKSWFFYAPDIATVIDDLASAPFGTPMNDPMVVPFPGAFMVRAVGVAGGAPEAVLDPAAVGVTVAPGATVTTAVTLSNAGSADLTYAVGGTTEFVVDFEDGQIPPYLTLGHPGNFIVNEGGQPGAWLRNNSLATFAPSLYLHEAPGGAESPFLGNYVDRQVSRISLDAQLLDVSITVAERPMSLQLVRYNGEPENPEAHDYVYLPIGLAPQPGEGWQHYVYDIPWDYAGVLPEGWGGGYYEDPEMLPPGVTFQDVISKVDEVRIMWGHPAFFYILQDFDLGVDNVAITYAGTDGPVAVSPAQGTIAPGQSQKLTLTIDASGLATGEHLVSLSFETNDPAHPTLTLPVTITVQPLSADGGAQPAAIALDAAYPNPLSDGATVRFTVPHPEHVTLAVFDAAGRRVATLLDGSVEAGSHDVTWNASGVASGVYLVRLQAGAAVQTLRATVVR